MPQKPSEIFFFPSSFVFRAQYWPLKMLKQYEWVFCRHITFFFSVFGFKTSRKLKQPETVEMIVKHQLKENKFNNQQGKPLLQNSLALIKALWCWTVRLFKLQSHKRIRLMSVCHTQMGGQWETWQPVAASRFVPLLSAHYITNTVPFGRDTRHHLQLSLIAWVYGKWRGSRRRSCRRAFCLQAESLLSNRRRNDDLWIEAL